MGKKGGRITLLSTLAFVFVLGVLVLVHEFGHFIVAKLMRVRVEVFSIGFGKKLYGIKRGDTEYRISLVPLGGYIKLSGDTPEEKRDGKSWEFLSKSPGERAAIVIAGPAFNYLIAFLLFSLVFFVGVPNLTSKIGMLKDNYPAQIAGIQQGDRILSIDGEKVELWGELSAIIYKKTDGKKISLRIEREDEIFTLKLIPNVESTNNIFGDDIKIGLIGIMPAEETKIVRYGLFESVKKGEERIVTLTQMTYFSLYRMTIGKMSVRDSLAGPVVIFKITGEAAKLGFVYLLQIMAALSVSLAIINLFPIPVLDGGHLLFLLFEKIKGKPVSMKVQEISARVGLSLLVVLMIFVFYNDLVRIGAFEKALKLLTG